MNWQKITLFLSGLFFGGAIDHVILAPLNSPLTPYGVKWGVAGNWAPGALGVVLATLCYGLHRFPAAPHKRRSDL